MKIPIMTGLACLSLAATAYCASSQSQESIAGKNSTKNLWRNFEQTQQGERMAFEARQRQQRLQALQQAEHMPENEKTSFLKENKEKLQQERLQFMRQQALKREEFFVAYPAYRPKKNQRLKQSQQKQDANSMIPANFTGTPQIQKTPPESSQPPSAPSSPSPAPTPS